MRGREGGGGAQRMAEAVTEDAASGGAGRASACWPLVSLPLVAYAVSLLLARSAGPWPSVALGVVFGLQACWLLVVWPLAEVGRARRAGGGSVIARGLVGGTAPVAALAIALALGVASHRACLAALGVQVTLALFVAAALALPGRLHAAVTRGLPLFAVLLVGIALARQATLAEPVGSRAGPLAWAALASDRPDPSQGEPPTRAALARPATARSDPAAPDPGRLRPRVDVGRAGFPLLVAPEGGAWAAPRIALPSTGPRRVVEGLDRRGAGSAAAVVPDGGAHPFAEVAPAAAPLRWRSVPPSTTLHLVIGEGAASRPDPGPGVVVSASRFPGPLAALRAFDAVERRATVAWSPPEQRELDAFRAWRAARRRLPDPSVDPRAYDELAAAGDDLQLPAWRWALAALLALASAAAGWLVGARPASAVGLALLATIGPAAVLPASRATVREDVVLALRVGSPVAAEERWVDVVARAAGLAKLSVPIARTDDRGAGVLEAVRAQVPEPLCYSIVSGAERARVEGLRLPAGGRRLFRLTRSVRLAGGIEVIETGGRAELLNETGLPFRAAYLVREGWVHALGALPDGGAAALGADPDGVPLSAFLVRAPSGQVGLLRLALRVRRRGVPLVLLVGAAPPRPLATGGLAVAGSRVALLALDPESSPSGRRDP